MPDAATQLFNAPIPGANYTADTKNFPWHRPPEFTDIDSAIDFAAKRLMSKNNAFSLLTMLEMGMTVTQAADIFVTSGIGGGKWTPDFAIILAGPIAHIIKLMADGYGIKYEMGYDDNEKPLSPAMFNQTPINEKKVSSAISEAKKGIASMRSKAKDMKKSGFMSNVEENTEPTDNSQEEGLE